MIQQNATNMTSQQIEFVEFVAAGKRTSDGRKLSMDAFARKLKVNRSTLYHWQDEIPDFWGVVQARANESLARYVPEVIDALKERALAGDVAAAKVILNQASALKPSPKTSLDVDLHQPLSIEIVNYATKQQST